MRYFFQRTLSVALVGCLILPSVPVHAQRLSPDAISLSANACANQVLLLRETFLKNPDDFLSIREQLSQWVALAMQPPLLVPVVAGHSPRLPSHVMMMKKEKRGEELNDNAAAQASPMSPPPTVWTETLEINTRTTIQSVETLLNQTVQALVQQSKDDGVSWPEWSSLRVQSFGAAMLLAVHEAWFGRYAGYKMKLTASLEGANLRIVFADNTVLSETEFEHVLDRRPNNRSSLRTLQKQNRSAGRSVFFERVHDGNGFAVTVMVPLTPEEDPTYTDEDDRNALSWAMAAGFEGFLNAFLSANPSDRLDAQLVSRRIQRTIESQRTFSSFDSFVRLASLSPRYVKAIRQAADQAKKSLSHLAAPETMEWGRDVFKRRLHWDPSSKMGQRFRDWVIGWSVAPSYEWSDPGNPIVWFQAHPHTTNLKWAGQFIGVVLIYLTPALVHYVFTIWVALNPNAGWDLWGAVIGFGVWIVVSALAAYDRTAYPVDRPAWADVRVWIGIPFYATTWIAHTLWNFFLGWWRLSIEATPIFQLKPSVKQLSPAPPLRKTTSEVEGRRRARITFPEDAIARLEAANPGLRRKMWRIAASFKEDLVDINAGDDDFDRRSRRRRIFLKLDQPVEVEPGRWIYGVHIKGVAESPQAIRTYFNISHEALAAGYDVQKVALDEMVLPSYTPEGRFKHIPKPRIPNTGNVWPLALHEYSFDEQARDAGENFPYPLAVIEYPDDQTIDGLSHGALILGLSAPEDVRMEKAFSRLLQDYEADLELKIVGRTTAGFRQFVQEARFYIVRQMQALRRLHEKGLAHGNFHLGNTGEWLGQMLIHDNESSETHWNNSDAQLFGHFLTDIKYVTQAIHRLSSHQFVGLLRIPWATYALHAYFSEAQNKSAVRLLNYLVQLEKNPFSCLFKEGQVTPLWLVRHPMVDLMTSFYAAPETLAIRAAA